MAERQRDENDVADIHRQVDRRVAPLQALHRQRLQCRLGCYDCCVDGLTVFEIEAEEIQRHYRFLLQSEAPHPPGKCAFLSAEGACRIYAHRPYVCRTQGLPLRWQEEDEAGEWVEYRDICPLNEEGTPIEELPEEQCWTIGEVEGQLAQRQCAKDGGAMRRVALRDLWTGRR